MPAFYYNASYIPWKKILHNKHEDPTLEDARWAPVKWHK